MLRDMPSSFIPICQHLTTEPALPALVFTFSFESFPGAEHILTHRRHAMELFDMLNEFVFAPEGAILTRSDEAVRDTVAVVMFIEGKLSIAEDAAIALESPSGPVKRHADPFTLVKVLGLFVAFPGSFADGDTTECALEDVSKFLGRSWVNAVVASVA
jgi:hypothetical protein